MNLLAIEILLLAIALKRGWRITPFVLFALPWLGGMFELTGTAHALAHAVALIGLIVTCWSAPAELPARVLGRAAERRRGPLYQI